MNNPGKPWRLFVAVNTPADVRQQAEELTHRLAASGGDVKWESASKLHCTVKFLGDTDPARVDEITNALTHAVAGIPPVSVRYETLGCFPDRNNPRVIWIGITNDDGALIALFQAIERALASIGFLRDERPFHPHLTLGRVRSRRSMEGLLRSMESITFQCEKAPLRELELIRSELQPAGSVYTILKTISLTTEGPTAPGQIPSRENEPRG